MRSQSQDPQAATAPLASTPRTRLHPYTKYFITAGHCFSDDGYHTSSGWLNFGFNFNQSTRTFGYNANQSIDWFGDFGIVPIPADWTPTNIVAVLPSASTTLNYAYPITNDVDAGQGARVCVTGSVQFLTACGVVVNTAYGYQPPGEVLQNYVQANWCGTGQGDSGGPVYAVNTAYGVYTGFLGAQTDCNQLYSRISGAEYKMNVNVVH
jgi:hypothetical protein